MIILTLQKQLHYIWVIDRKTIAFKIHEFDIEEEKIAMK
jgi:hypothetical protein